LARKSVNFANGVSLDCSRAAKEAQVTFNSIIFENLKRNTVMVILVFFLKLLLYLQI
jgi:hypothetical protein